MDKELALIIAEMLIKQDETTAQLKEHNQLIKETNNSIKETNNSIKETNNSLTETNNFLKETNDILKEFMGISVKQWEQQHVFNEIIAGELKEIKNTLYLFRSN